MLRLPNSTSKTRAAQTRNVVTGHGSHDLETWGRQWLAQTPHGSSGLQQFWRDAGESHGAHKHLCLAQTLMVVEAKTCVVQLGVPSWKDDWSALYCTCSLPLCSSVLSGMNLGLQNSEYEASSWCFSDGS